VRAHWSDHLTVLWTDAGQHGCRRGGLWNNGLSLGIPNSHARAVKVTQSAAGRAGRRSCRGQEASDRDSRDARARQRFVLTLPFGGRRSDRPGRPRPALPSPGTCCRPDRPAVPTPFRQSALSYRGRPHITRMDQIAPYSIGVAGCTSAGLDQIPSRLIPYSGYLDRHASRQDVVGPHSCPDELGQWLDFAR